MTAEPDQGSSGSSPRTLAEKLDAIRRDRALPVGYYREAARLVADVAVSLHRSHETGGIHGSLTPNVILIDEADRPEVIGFAPAGTGGDRRADILALGAVLYEMLSLERPFRGGSPGLLSRMLRPGPPDPRRVSARVPRELAAVCMQAMETSAARRYATMEEFADDLGRYLSGDAVAAEPAGTAGRLWQVVRRRPLPSAAAVVIWASVIGAFLYLAWTYPRVLQESNKLSRLADAGILSELRAEEERLWPAEPARIPAMERWLERARDLHGRLALHRGALEALRRRARPDSSMHAGLGDWSFADAADQWRHDILSGLVAGIAALGDERFGSIRNVEERLAFARSITAASIETRREEWERAAASIADEKECPFYGGLKLAPQLGLAPVGRDPSSKLWEFAHLQTGRVPERGDDGKLAVDGETGLVFVLVPGGKFDMGAARPSDARPEGSAGADPQAEDDEAPVRTVTVPPFFLSKYEMTQGQWFRFARRNPSSYGAGRNFGDREITGAHPVESVSWNEAVQALDRLGLRLPSEAEWEYAARAGSGSIWWTGNYRESLARSANLGDIALEKYSTGAGRAYEDWLLDGYAAHAPVTAFRANAFGLHGVCGNVWEWCRDRYHASYAGAPVDGSAWEDEGDGARDYSLKVTGGDADLRVFRGGGWDNLSRHCRSANRSRGSEDFRYHNLGLRPARSID
jgi:formylglycine-generating enzyme required for sulfatase activity